MTDNESTESKKEIGHLTIRIDANADALHATFDSIEKRIKAMKAELAELNAAPAGSSGVIVQQSIDMQPGLAETVAAAIRAEVPGISAMAHKVVADAMKPKEHAEMKYEHLVIKANAAGEALVILNGVALKGVRAVSHKVGVEEASEVTITLVANVNCDA